MASAMRIDNAVQDVGATAGKLRRWSVSGNVSPDAFDDLLRAMANGVAVPVTFRGTDSRGRPATLSGLAIPIRVERWAKNPVSVSPPPAVKVVGTGPLRGYLTRRKAR